MKTHYTTLLGLMEGMSKTLFKNMEMEKEKVWDFIEKFLPNYFSREDVALYNDLFKLYYNEFGIGDEANHLLKDSYQNDLSNPKIGRDLKQLEQSLYKEARENYLKESKK